MTAVTVSERIAVALDDVYAVREGMVLKRLINRPGYFGVEERSHWITSAGIREAEAREVIDPALVKEHKRVRAEILRQLRKVRTERGRHSPWHPMEDNEIGVSIWTLKLVLEILDENGLVYLFQDHEGAYGVTDAGMHQLTVWDREAGALELDRIEALEPQRRGKALEAVLADALRLQGCHCVEDTGGGGEQIDLVVECDSVFYLCEAKWLKKRVQTPVVDQMVGRLNRRPPVVPGVIFSMSDFTPKAREKAAQHATHRTILLLGEDDTRGIIGCEHTFKEIVSSQLRNLVTRGSL